MGSLRSEKAKVGWYMSARRTVDVVHASQFARDVVGSRIKGSNLCPGVPAGLVYRKPPPWKYSPRSRRAGKTARLSNEDWSTWRQWPALSAADYQFDPVSSGLDIENVPKLAHGLDVVLRNRGVHPVKAVLRPPHLGSGSVVSRWLGDNTPKRIHQPNEINWASIPSYLRASEDVSMHRLAQNMQGVRYTSSTSSVTAILSKLFYTLSNFGDTRLVGGLSTAFADQPMSYTKLHRKPVSVIVRPNEYSSADKKEQSFSIDQVQLQHSSPSILRDLGHSMERMLTMSMDDFSKKVLLENPLRNISPLTSQSFMDSYSSARNSDHPPQYYNYSRAGAFLLRAQIDCRDSDTGEVFDLKTRAVAPIRYNLHNYRSLRDQEISNLTGIWDSYEREFYDMVRSVFLKYALQLRIGRMSGAFVTYHNTNEVLGFEFLSLDEMEAYIFGNKFWADRAFSLCLQVFERILDEVTSFMSPELSQRVKIVVHPHIDCRLIRIYAQKFDSAEGDPSGPSKFSALRELNRDRFRNAAFRLQSTRLNPFANGFIGPQVQNGIAVVTDDRVETDAARLQIFQSSGLNGSEACDAKQYALDKILSIANFEGSKVAAWDLRLAPIIDEKLMSEPYTIEDHQSFVLGYDLKRREVDHESLVQEFISACAAAYV